MSYIPGKELVIADALSRNYLEEVSDTDIIPEVISTISLAVSDTRKERIIEETSKDNICKKLIEYIETEWPSKHQIPDIMKPYYSIRAYIIYTNGLLFKEQLLIIPHNLQEEMLNQTHSAHSGISACKRRFKEVMYWPVISRGMEKFVEECKICKQHVEITNKHETLQQHDRAKSPWAKIGMDLCQIGDRTSLVVTDYYSNFLSVEKVDNTNCKGIIKILLKMFAIHGIPQEIVSDNGLQFRSELK